MKVVMQSIGFRVYPYANRDRIYISVGLDGPALYAWGDLVCFLAIKPLYLNTERPYTDWRLGELLELSRLAEEVLERRQLLEIKET